MGRIVLVTCLLLCAGCGGGSHDRLFEEQLDLFKETTGVLAGVKDGESARAAKPQLRDIAERMQTLGKREKDLPPLTAEESAHLREKYKDRALDVGKYAEEIVRLKYLASPEVKAEIDADLQNLRMESQHVQLFLKK